MITVATRDPPPLRARGQLEEAHCPGREDGDCAAIGRHARASPERIADAFQSRDASARVRAGREPSRAGATGMAEAAGGDERKEQSDAGDG